MKFVIFMIFNLSTHFAQAAAPVVNAKAIINQSVGEVSGRITTSREVQISTVIEHVLDKSKADATKTDKKIEEIKLDDAKFVSEVTSLLLEQTVRLEAQSFDVGQVSEANLKKALEEVEQAVKGKAYWESLEVSPKELKQMVEQKLWAKNFIKFKSESMNSIVSDQEAQVYYDKNRAKFGNSTFSSFKDNIKTYLGQQQLQERLRAWFEAIKRKYKVRNYLVEGKST